MYKTRQMFISAQVKIISKTNGSLPVAVVTWWVVELCRPEQLKGKVYIYTGSFFNKESVPIGSLSFPLCLVVEGDICEKGFQMFNVLFCPYCHFPRISSCFSATLRPAYSALMHLFCLQNSLLICWKCCQGVKLCIRSLKSAKSDLLPETVKWRKDHV